jgi:hypothetical protein
MVENLFPMEEEVETNKLIPGKAGIYRVKVLKQPTVNVVPLKKDSAYNWAFREGFEASVGNVSLEDVKAHGGKFRIIDGTYWPKSRDIFSAYIRPLYEVKKQQDYYLETGDKRYNPSLRNIVKLLLNSLSGKVIQRTYTELTKIIETKKQWDSFRKRIDLTKKHQIMVQNNTAYVVGTLKEDEIRRDIPIIWGVMIYEYARSYMYNQVYTKIPGIIYTETDSYVAPYRIIEKDVKKRPHMYGPNMGQFTLKYHEKKEVVETVVKGVNGRKDKVVKETITTPLETYCIPIAKKCACLYDSKTKKILKATFKGVNQKGDKVVTEKEYKSLKTDREKFEFYHDETKGTPVGLSTYLKLVEGKKLTIMCGQLTRRLRPDLNIAPIAHIKQVFRLKHFPRDHNDDSEAEDLEGIETGPPVEYTSDDTNYSSNDSDYSSDDSEDELCEIQESTKESREYQSLHAFVEPDYGTEEEYQEYDPDEDYRKAIMDDHDIPSDCEYYTRSDEDYKKALMENDVFPSDYESD